MEAGFSSETRRMTDTALLVIDMQEALIDGAWEIGRVVGNVRTLIDRAHRDRVPVVYVQHCHATYSDLTKGAPGWAIHAPIAPIAGDTVIEKTASDSFYRTELAAVLTRLGVRRLVVTGMQSEFCVDATCRAALSHGFDVALVADGHTTGPSHLSAETVIAHHNRILPWLAHPEHTITAVEAGKVDFAAARSGR
jgi:nicotinamidase-related amidase